MNRRSHNDLVAIAVLESDPPALTWRPLRVVFEIIGVDDVHLWAVYQRPDGVYGYVRPTIDLENAISDGAARMLPAAMRLGADEVLVRNGADEFAVRKLAAVVRERRAEYHRVLREALNAAAAGDIEAAKVHFDRAVLIEDTPPIAAVLRRGFAEDVPEDDPWRGEVIDEFAAAAPSMEIDIVASYFGWETFPSKELRARWLGRALVAAVGSAEPADLSSLRPAGQDAALRAALIVTAHRLDLDARLRLPHRILARVVDGDPAAVESVIRAYRQAAGLTTDAECVEALRSELEARGGARAAELERELTARARVTDLLRTASLVARIDATLGRGERIHLWRSAAASLRAIRIDPRFAPWQRGEAAAEQLRMYWGLHLGPIRDLGALLRTRLGLERVAIDLGSDRFDACHVLEPQIPPSSYIQRHIADKSGRVRFAIAKGVGWRILNPTGRGVWFSRPPDPSAVKTEGEKAANAFAAYFIAPRSEVRTAIGALALDTFWGYRDAVQRVMEIFGLSASAAFVHVANCHQIEVPFEWKPAMESALAPDEASRTGSTDVVSVPDVPEGSGIVLERADGVSTRLAEAVVRGFIEHDEAEALIGVSTDVGRRWFREKVEAEVAKVSQLLS